MFNPNENNQNNGPFHQMRTTRVSIGLVSMMGIVSFLGLLPKFAPFLVLSGEAFFLPFPKVWVLFTGVFYHSSIFFGFFSALIFVFLAAQIEPIMGSKEFLRIFIMIGFYSSFLTLIFILVMFLITGNALILERPFEMSGAPLSAYVMWMAHEFIDLKIPTLCGRARVRTIPFYLFLFEALTSLIGSCDGILAPLFGNLLMYLYLRFIKKNGNRRGDSSFSIDKLLPTCDASTTQSDDDDDGGNGGPGGMFAFPGQHMQDGPEGGISRFQLDNNPTPSRQNRNNNQNRQSRFQGTPHTLAD